MARTQSAKILHMTHPKSSFVIDRAAPGDREDILE
jgi:hypothetical protein